MYIANPLTKMMHKYICDTSSTPKPLSQKEKIELIKQKFNLTHGKGKRKRKSKKKKGNRPA